MKHIVLLGDSILDNTIYVKGGPDVIGHLNSLLPQDWQASLLAVDGSLWIGTENLGLFRLYQGRISHMGTAEGLKSDFVGGLQATPDGSIWIAAGGLARFKDDKLEYPSIRE